MDFREYKQYDGVALADLIKKRSIQPLDVLQACLEGMRAHQQLNAVVSTREKRATEELKDLHAEQLFQGVPFLLKNSSQALKGEEINAGSPLLTGSVAKESSHYTKRLQHAGFIMMGYTNSPEFGLKNITEPKLYGATKNPHNDSYSPGGSSGGAAAAVASGIVPIAGASDGGGSIRIPASFTGLVGLKPTRGRTPVGPGAGRQWQGAAIDFVLSRSVRDSARALDVLQTYQPEAAFHTPLFVEGFEETMHQAPPMRIAYSYESPVGTPVSDDAKTALMQTVQYLDSLGYELEEASPSIDGRYLMQQYYLMNAGEMANMRRRLEKTIGRALREEELETESFVLSEAGRHVSAAQYASSLTAWDEHAAKAMAFHQNYDLYLTPGTASIAPKIGELTPSLEEEQRLKDSVQRLGAQDQLDLVYEMFLPSLTYTPFTQLANLTGQPAMNIPVYQTNQGMPIGVQAIASKGNEASLIRLAAMLEQSDLWQG
ncbi:amidase family protein [Alkalihalobacillus sp. LMS6]|uniref:amidase family protein n=1 Tax=Alkalihalobacillus sp. LMS6 TaxID=2924034 RepID=UPI0020D1C32F|nr:amidase family protein [Alkalihalobacillus sp. LMS6]UTR05073.1 amidase family protein [Alkalihalobacillus sp. LMS6]